MATEAEAAAGSDASPEPGGASPQLHLRALSDALVRHQLDQDPLQALLDCAHDDGAAQQLLQSISESGLGLVILESLRELIAGHKQALEQLSRNTDMLEQLYLCALQDAVDTVAATGNAATQIGSARVLGTGTRVRRDDLIASTLALIEKLCTDLHAGWAVATRMHAQAFDVSVVGQVMTLHVHHLAREVSTLAERWQLAHLTVKQMYLGRIDELLELAKPHVTALDVEALAEVMRQAGLAHEEVPLAAGAAVTRQDRHPSASTEHLPLSERERGLSGASSSGGTPSPESEPQPALAHDEHSQWDAVPAASLEAALHDLGRAAGDGKPPRHGSASSGLRRFLSAARSRGERGSNSSRRRRSKDVLSVGSSDISMVSSRPSGSRWMPADRQSIGSHRSTTSVRSSASVSSSPENAMPEFPCSPSIAAVPSSPRCCDAIAVAPAATHTRSRSFSSPAVPLPLLPSARPPHVPAAPRASSPPPMALARSSSVSPVLGQPGQALSLRGREPDASPRSLDEACAGSIEDQTRPQGRADGDSYPDSQDSSDDALHCDLDLNPATVAEAFHVTRRGRESRPSSPHMPSRSLRSLSSASATSSCLSAPNSSVLVPEPHPDRPSQLLQQQHARTMRSIGSAGFRAGHSRSGSTATVPAAESSDSLPVLNAADSSATLTSTALTSQDDMADEDALSGHASSDAAVVLPLPLHNKRARTRGLRKAKGTPSSSASASASASAASSVGSRSASASSAAPTSASDASHRVRTWVRSLFSGSGSRSNQHGLVPWMSPSTASSPPLSGPMIIAEIKQLYLDLGVVQQAAQQLQQAARETWWRQHCDASRCSIEAMLLHHTRLAVSLHARAQEAAAAAAEAAVSVHEEQKLAMQDQLAAPRGGHGMSISPARSLSTSPGATTGSPDEARSAAPDKTDISHRRSSWLRRAFSRTNSRSNSLSGGQAPFAGRYVDAES